MVENYENLDYFLLFIFFFEKETPILRLTEKRLDILLKKK